MSKQTLALMPETFVIHSMAPNIPVPQDVFSASVYFVGKTRGELSIVVPDTVRIESDESESGWRALEVLGPLGFSMVGILSKISSALARRNISIFAISTFDTDYILVKQDSITQGIDALRDDGYNVIAEEV